VPLDSNEDAEGDQLLEVTLDMPLEELADFEVVEDGKPYRGVDRHSRPDRAAG
jgi:hypothetical protein